MSPTQKLLATLICWNTTSDVVDSWLTF